MAEGKIFYSIDEVSQEVGVEKYVIRFWEKNFTQIKPDRRAGRRYFRQADVDIILRIKDLLYKQGFTIKGAKKALGESPSRRAVPETVEEPVKRTSVLSRWKSSVAPVVMEPAAAPVVPAPKISAANIDAVIRKIEEIEGILTG